MGFYSSITAIVVGLPILLSFSTNAQPVPRVLKISGPEEGSIGTEIAFDLLSSTHIGSSRPLSVWIQHSSWPTEKLICSEDGNYQELPRDASSLLQEYRITVFRGFENGHGCRGWAFGEGGDYSFWVSVGSEKSTPVKIRILDFKNEDEHKWWLNLAKHPAAIDLMAGRNVLDAIGAFGMENVAGSIRLLRDHEGASSNGSDASKVEHTINRVRDLRIADHPLNEHVIHRLKDIFEKQ